MESITLSPIDSDRRMLVIFAHPDDESFGPGGTLAKYAREGVAVHYACATRGEAGTVAPEHIQPFEQLPEDLRLAALREGELRCAADTLGLAGLHLLGYRDSGMAGTADNRDARAFVNADPDQVTEQLVGLMRAIRPQVVLTFDPYGGYGHPDHIFAHECTMDAFRAAGDADRYPQAGAPYRPQKLYWTAFGLSWLKWVVRIMPLLGRDPSKFGQNQDVDLRELAIRASNAPVTTRIDVWPYYSAKMAASACHASQASPAASLGRAPRWLQRRMLGYERFTRVEPSTYGRRITERDLFEGVDAFRR